MADDLAKLRAELNFGAIDTPDFIKAIQAAYQNMPGAGVAQAGLAMGSDMAGNILGNLYGAGKQVATGQLNGSPQGSEYAFNQAQDFANQMHYTPPTQAGRDIYEGVNKLPQVLTGSHMGVGPLPEIWNNAPRMSPDDLRVAGRTLTEDVRNFPSDYANAQAGIQREYPTMGSRAAGATDTATQIAKPLAEMAYNQVMETGGIKQPFGMPDIPVANFAVKPGGGNNPMNLGSTAPLSEQGKMGKYLSSLQISDPTAAFVKQLESHHPNSNENYKLQKDWEEFLDKYASNKDPEYHNYISKDNPAIQQLKREAADKFSENYNVGAEAAGNKKLYTPSKIEEMAPHFNAWVMGPYQKYITNQMGTGLPTDTIVKAMDEANIPLSEIVKNPSDISVMGQENLDYKRKSFADAYKNAGLNLEDPAYANIGKQTATTPAGQRVEAELDRTFSLNHTNKWGIGEFGNQEKYPQLARLGDSAVINDFSYGQPDKESLLPSIHKKVLKDLLTGSMLPKDIPKALPANVLKQIIQDYKDEQAGKAAVQKRKDDWRAARFASLQSDIPYEDGSKMHVITPEDANSDENLVARDLGQSTIDLNQCVGAGCRNTPDYPGHGPYIEPHTGRPPKGTVEYDKFGYMQRLKNGNTEIARLIDPNGVAQATVRLDLEKQRLTDYEKDKIVNQWIKDNAPDFRDEYNTNIEAFGEKPALKTALQLYPELENVLKNATPIEKSVGEMKGKDNGDIPKEYVPHMVDWLNKLNDSNQLLTVRDLEHLPQIHDLDDHYTSIGKMIDERPHWYSPTVEEFFKKAEDEKLLPRFFTNDQFARLATDHGVDLSAEPPKKLSDWDKQTLREEVYSVLVKDPNSLYLQDNLKDHVVENLDLLFGDREPEGQIPLDVHRKLVDMLLDQNGKYRDQLISALGQLADKGPNSWTDQFTAQQTKNMLNIMAGWFDKHPMEKLPTNEDFLRAIMHHPDPFSEIEIPESPWHPTENDLVNAMHEMEPENADEFDQVNAIRERAYQNAIGEIPRQWNEAFVNDLNNNPRSIEALVGHMQVNPQAYNLTNYSPAVRNAIIDKIRQNGIPELNAPAE